MNMHYTLFPFPPPYYLPLYPIDYSMHSAGALIDVMVDVEWTMSPRFLSQETNERKPIINTETELMQCAPPRSPQSQPRTDAVLLMLAIMASSPLHLFISYHILAHQMFAYVSCYYFLQ